MMRVAVRKRCVGPVVPCVVLFVAAACGGSSTTEPSAAAKLLFAAQPAAVGAGAAIAPEIRVAVQDASGKTVTKSTAQVTLSLGANPGGATLSGTLSAVASEGVAVFTNVRLDRAGTGYTLVASASGLTSATSQPFDVGAGAPVRVRFQVQPSDVRVREPMQPNVEVRFVDGFDNLVSSATGTVTLSLANNSSGASLSGVTEIAVGGVAVFPDLRIDRIGRDYRLVASAAQVIFETSTPFEAWTEMVSIAAGGSNGVGHTCGLTPEGDAYCWGGNLAGELGTGTQTPTSLLPSAVAGDLTWSALGAGGSATCGITSTGALYCWGSNHFGKLGTGASFGGLQRTPAAVAGSHTFASVSVGISHVCGITSSGAAYCWGMGGVLGDGTTFERDSPVPVLGGHTFQSISAGEWHTCGVTTNGTAYCWGGNSDGALGNEDFDSALEPVPVSGGLSFATVSVGINHSCALTVDGSAYCWGSGPYGQLGDGSGQAAGEPVPVAGGHSFVSLNSGSAHTCGVTAAGEIWCWGLNSAGQLGTASTQHSADQVPVKTAGGHTFLAVSGGDEHTCGITTEKAAYCWGSNQTGQLGDGSEIHRLVPTRVAH